MPRFLELLPATTRSARETELLGERMAAHLRPGDVVALYGDLGAGKTHLVRGIARGLGVTGDVVSSPTFTLVHEYRGAACPVYHVDVYRLKTLDEFVDLGYEDLFAQDVLCLLEWPERVETLLPPEAVRLRLRHEGDTARHVEEG